jgi:FlaA1/EpsC-like NDP-sugar epimerase
VTLPRFVRGRRIFLPVWDAVLFAAAYAGAYWIRLDLMSNPSAWAHCARTLLPVVVLKALVFVLAGTYRGLMLYATLPDLLLILRSGSLASLVVVLALEVVPGLRLYSRGIMVVDWMLTIGLVAGSRVAWRALREGLLSRDGRVRGRKQVLIVGAGRAGVALAKDLMTTHRDEVEVIGFVDDDPDKQGATLLGRPILGTTKDLPEIRHVLPVDQVIAAIPSASPRVLRRIAELARGVRDFRVVPALESLLRGTARIVESVAVPEETFLPRSTVELAASDLPRFFAGKTVLVTGAGGSIGSELARQIAQFAQRDRGSLRTLLLLDAAETPLYDIHREMNAILGERVLPILASVRDSRRMEALFSSARPDVVIHAAALKHVPMCERYPLEAIATNACATGRLAEMAHRHRVANFTLVSTDKAVAPACVMGASKRAAEALVRSFPRSPGTRFAAVRFGNVLGSNGSVLPLFHEQIARGGPVTVTDAEATRFFMTIPEACGLILQATRIAQGGDVYVLDMGEPVRILDLAHNLIRLYGYEPGRDIEVKIIGLRPGEKLHECLVDESEKAVPARQAKLLKIQGRHLERKRCRELLDELERSVAEPNEIEALRILSELVPTFHRAEPHPAVLPAAHESAQVPA